MQKLNEKKILGTVPKKLQLVETFWDCPEFSKNKQNQKGITLIALIITIIVMLILVGVTITVALNGGLFSKAEEAGSKTKITQIQEALTIKKAEILAEHDGVVEEYTLTLADLDLPTELENEFSGKLIIGTDGKLYYDGSVVTNKEEQDTFKEMGIQEYVETNTGNPYIFTIGELADRGLLTDQDVSVACTEEEFFPDYVSEELKNSKFIKTVNEIDYEVYNITCPDSQYENMFDTQTGQSGPNVFCIYIYEGMIIFGVWDENGETINIKNYTNYEDLTFKISMPE